MNPKLVSLVSYKSVRLPVYTLLAIIIVRTIVDMIVGIEKYSILFNVAIFFVLAAMIGAILFSMKKNKRQTSDSTGIRGSPLILFTTGLFVVIMGNILSLLGVYFGILFIIVGLVMLFESVTTKITVMDEGISVRYHPIFPFPRLYYPYSSLSDIKIRGPIIHLKHKQRTLGTKRFLLFDKKRFQQQLDNTSYMA